MANFFNFQSNRFVLNLDTNYVHRCGTLKCFNGFFDRLIEPNKPKHIVKMMENKEFVDKLTDDEVVFLTEKYL